MERFLQSLAGFLFMIVVVIFGVFYKTYWIGNNMVMESRLQPNDVELVVLEGSEQKLDVKLGDQVAQVRSALLYDVESPSKAKYVWKSGDLYRPVYGVFDSLDDAKQWAKDNGYQYDLKFEFVEASDQGTRVNLPHIYNNTEYVDVHVFTDRYAVLGYWTPTRAEPIEEYPMLYKTYLSLKE